MFLEQVMETAIAAIWHRRLIPRRQQLVPFGIGQQRQVGERGLGCGDDRFQQGPEMAGHPCDAGLIEQVGVVLPCRREAPPRFRHIEGQVELGRLPRHLHRAGGETRPRLRRPVVRKVLIGEHHLEERVVAMIARGVQFLDQSLEWQVLMRVRVDGGRAHPLYAPRGTTGCPTDRRA